MQCFPRAVIVIGALIIRDCTMKKAREHCSLSLSWKSSIQGLYFIHIISFSLVYVLLYLHFFEYLVYDSILRVKEHHKWN